MSNVDPPRISAWLIACASIEDRGALQGDLHEEFHTVIVPRLGPHRARAWYRRQAVASISALALFASRDIVGAFFGAVVALVAWQLAVYQAMSLGLATDTPLADLSGIAFALVWVFGGTLAAGIVGAVFKPRRANAVAALAALAGVTLLLLGVDEPVSLGYRHAWGIAAMTGAFLGAFLGRRWAATRSLA